MWRKRKMIVGDKIIGVMEKRIQKWMKIKQTKRIGGQLSLNGLEEKIKNNQNNLPKFSIIDFYPFFMSITHKKIEEINIQSCSTGFTKEPKYASNQSLDARIEARIGEEDSHSIAYGSGGAPTEKDLDALDEVIDACCDDAVKDALSKYFMAHSDLCRKKDKFLFKKISKEDKAVYIDNRKINVKNEDIKEFYDIIKKISLKLNGIKFVEDFDISYSIVNETKRFVNSEDTKIKTFSFKGSLFVTTYIRHKDGGESTMSAGYYGKNIRELKKEKQIIKKIDKLIGDIHELYPAKPQESGVFPAIFTPHTLGTFLHEAAAAHLLSAKNVLEGDTTVFALEKIGKLILPEFITLIDDPTQPNQWGSYKFDEEGIAGQKVVLVENGILKNYLTDRTTAGFLGQKSNGHSRAEEDNDPEPRISNLSLITSQKYSLKDLENALMDYCKKNKLEYGLIIDAHAGDVDTEDQSMGNFRIYPNKIIRLYTDGKKEVVSRAWLIGEPYQMLNEIKMLGGQYKKTCGFCGAESGLVFAQEITPYAFLEKVEVRREPEKNTDQERLDNDMDE